MNYAIRQATRGDRPAHPELIPIIGQKLAGIWLLPGSLFMAFDDGQVIQAELAPGLAGFERGLLLKIGHSKPGTDWHAVLTGLDEPPAPFQKLIGQPFRGLDIDVFQFGSELGIKLDGQGVRLLRAPEVNR